MIVFGGDPHGNFTPIIRGCLTRRPGTLVLVGDCDCRRPLPVLLAPLFDAGWDVRWILGNHDTDSEATYDNLVTAHPAGDLGLTVAEIDGVRIAGLPGVFKPRVWHPQPGPECVDPPTFGTRAAFLAAGAAPWRGGMPLWHRDTIFPEDFDHLQAQRFDVLVAHEAPTAHPCGFAAIDALAEAAGARLVVHGHHHDSYAGVLPSGIAVRGLGLAELWDLP